MANIHGFRDIPQNNNQQRNPFRQPFQRQTQPLREQIDQNKIPFLRPMDSDRSPLDQTIPYTLKIIWCPTLTIFSPSIVLLIICWALYIVCLTQGIDYRRQEVLTIDINVLIRFGAMKRDLLQDGQFWRLLTAAVLHINLLHITMNSLSILFFLTRLERIYNPLLVTLLMLVSAVSGNILSAFNDDTVVSAGASTIIFGGLGVYVGFMITNWETLGELKTQLCCIIGFIVFLSIISSFSSEVDLLGHLGGLIGGLLLCLAVFPTLRQKKKGFTIAGGAGLVIYFLVTFLTFYLN